MCYNGSVQFRAKIEAEFPPKVTKEELLARLAARKNEQDD
jgi:hypothetical protein